MSKYGIVQSGRADTTGRTYNVVASPGPRKKYRPGSLKGTVWISGTFLSASATVQAFIQGSWRNVAAALTAAGKVEVDCVCDAIRGVVTGGGTNEVQLLTVTATGGTFTISFDGQTTTALAYNADAATVELALEALSNIAVGEASCSGALSTGMEVTFTGQWAEENVPAMTCNSAALTGTATPATQTAGVAAVDEIQTITVDATGGDFTVTFLGQTTGAIAFDANAATVQTALEALSNVEPGEATTAGTLAGGMSITFTGQHAATPLAEITTNAAGLTGGASTATPGTTTQGVAPVNEVQTVTVVATGGTFTITYAGQTTSAIAYNASAATVKAALEALSNIGVDEAICASTLAAGMTITFEGTLAGTNVDQVTCTSTLLTGTCAPTTDVPGASVDLDFNLLTDHELQVAAAV